MHMVGSCFTYEQCDHELVYPTPNNNDRYLVEWWMASDPVRNEVQVLKTASTALNSSSDIIVGTFQLSWGYGGEETDYLPADIGEAELEAALEALVEVRDVQVDLSAAFVLTSQ